MSSEDAFICGSPAARLMSSETRTGQFRVDGAVFERSGGIVTGIIILARGAEV